MQNRHGVLSQQLSWCEPRSSLVGAYATPPEEAQQAETEKRAVMSKHNANTSAVINAIAEALAIATKRAPRNESPARRTVKVQVDADAAAMAKPIIESLKGIAANDPSPSRLKVIDVPAGVTEAQAEAASKVQREDGTVEMVAKFTSKSGCDLCKQDIVRGTHILYVPPEKGSRKRRGTARHLACDIAFRAPTPAPAVAAPVAAPKRVAMPAAPVVTKVYVEAGALRAALHTCRQVADEVVLSAAGGYAYLTAGDKNTRVDVQVQTQDTKGRIDRVLVSAAELHKALIGKRDAAVGMVLTKDTLDVAVHGGPTLRLACRDLSALDMPESVAKPGAFTGKAELASLDLEWALSYAQDAASEDPTRSTLTAVYLDGGKVIGTDGHRMHVATMAHPFSDKDGGMAIGAVQAFCAFVNGFGTPNEVPTTLSHHETMWRIHQYLGRATLVVTSRAMQPSGIAFERFMPKGERFQVQANAAALVDACKAVPKDVAAALFTFG